MLGGGLVPGAMVLLAGEPGVGKSTLLLEVVRQWARTGTALYVTGEESAGQVRVRAERTGAVHERVYLAAETDLATLLGHVEAVRPELLVWRTRCTVNTADPRAGAGSGRGTPAEACVSGPGASRSWSSTRCLLA